MKRFSEQFYKKATSIKLKAREKRELRERLLSYMEYHPLPSHLQAVKAKENNTKSTFGFGKFVVSPTAFNFNMVYARAALGSLVVILVAAVPIFAERTLPGDILYPVKVQFNEEIRSSLSFSPYAKVEWETERLERRISEARLLASAGKLTSEVEAGVVEAVRVHSDKAQREIAFIRESDEEEADIAEIAFASALAIQSEVLEDHMISDIGAAGSGRSVALLAGAVAQVQQQAEDSQIGANPSYEKLLARVEMETTKAFELFSTVSKYASPEDVAVIDERLSKLKTKVDKAMTTYELAVTGHYETTATSSATTTAVAMSIESNRGTTSTSSLIVEEDVNTTTTDQKVIEIEMSPDELAERIESDKKVAKELLREALSDTKKIIIFMTDIDVKATVKTDKKKTPNESVKIEEGKEIEKIEASSTTRTEAINNDEGKPVTESLESVIKTKIQLP